MEDSLNFINIRMIAAFLVSTASRLDKFLNTSKVLEDLHKPFSQELAVEDCPNSFKERWSELLSLGAKLSQNLLKELQPIESFCGDTDSFVNWITRRSGLKDHADSVDKVINVVKDCSVTTAEEKSMRQQDQLQASNSKDAASLAGNSNCHSRMRISRRSKSYTSNQKLTSITNSPLTSNVHVRKMHSCSQCDKQFRCRSELNKHCQLHSGKHQFTCKSCNQHFSCAASLRSHACQHQTTVVNMDSTCLVPTADKPFQCGTCQKCFTLPKFLRIHVARIYSKTAKSATGRKCHVCDARFADADTLRLHVKQHGDDGKNFLCSECGLKFVFPCYLRAHLRKHATDDRPFACTACGRRFIYRSQLAVHERTHTGARPFMCSQCGVQFAHIGALRRHGRSHAGARPHVCTTCGRQFAQGTHMRRHALTHSGLQPFSCVICQQGFTQLSSLKRHMKLHSDQTATAGSTQTTSVGSSTP